MFDKFSKKIVLASILVSGIVLSSCGGGGSEDKNTNSTPDGNTNSPPIAVDDKFSVTLAETVELNSTMLDGVLANDSDPNSNTLEAVLISDVKSGNLTLNSDGSFSYRYTGPSTDIDSFTYQAKNAFDVSSTATVSIVINHDPVINSGCSTTAQGVAISGTLKATSVDGTLLTYKLGVDGSDGSGPINTALGSVEITDPTTGDYIYTPLATGSRGSDSFKFFVVDESGGSVTATETVIVKQKIMPLGDSITRGTGDGSSNDGQKVGYRKPLYDSLNTAGYSFDFVGSDATTGGSVANFDSDNEGHGGWTSSEIAFGRVGVSGSGIGNWLNMNPADIILLHIGTNDGPVPGSSEIDTASILDEIDAWEKSSNGNPVTVILAKIVNQNPFNTDVTNYNAALVSMVLARIMDDIVIVIVDMESQLSYPADLSDKFHPNAGGYAKMAPVWHDELIKIMDKCP